ncbi:50S ribosomal protein L1 [Candidatus Peribacteria bacterium]|nr:50S ribosomal protein L1 [Candidatus Peribacteria bacterium]
MKTSKRLATAAKAYNAQQSYSLADAIGIVRATTTVKFDATVEAHFNLGIDPRHADQQLRTTVTLPHGTGKKARVAVVTTDDKWADAKQAGAVEAGGEELIDKIMGGWTDFDVLVATPDMMRSLAKAARTLGPKGLMPSPKAGTVTDDLTTTVKALVGGRFELRNDKAGLLHTVIGKVSFTDVQLQENLEYLIQTLKDTKPAGQKGLYLKKLTLNSTMGPGVVVNLNPEAA